MIQVDDLSRSLIAFEQISTLVIVVEFRRLGPGAQQLSRDPRVRGLADGEDAGVVVAEQHRCALGLRPETVFRYAYFILVVFVGRNLPDPTARLLVGCGRRSFSAVIKSCGERAP